MKKRLVLSGIGATALAVLFSGCATPELPPLYHPRSTANFDVSAAVDELIQRTDIELVVQAQLSAQRMGINDQTAMRIGLDTKVPPLYKDIDPLLREQYAAIHVSKDIVPKLVAHGISPTVAAAYFPEGLKNNLNSWEIMRLAASDADINTALPYFKKGLGVHTVLALCNSLRGISSTTITDALTKEAIDKRVYHTELACLPEDASRILPIPKDLVALLFKNAPQIHDARSITNLILEASEKRSQKPFSSLTLQEALRLAGDVVADRMTYSLVDDQKNSFARKNGLFLPDDAYFVAGVGDCDKYTQAFRLVIDVLACHVPSLTNVYVCPNVGGDPEIEKEHSWVSVFSLAHSPQGLELHHTYLDPTIYDSEGVLEGQDVHGTDQDTFVKQMYATISNLKNIELKSR